MGKVLDLNPYLKSSGICPRGYKKDEARFLVYKAAYLLKTSEAEADCELAQMLEDFADLMLDQEYAAHGRS